MIIVDGRNGDGEGYGTGTLETKLCSKRIVDINQTPE